MVAETKKDAVSIIGGLDLSGYVDKAVRLGQLSSLDKEAAMREYRQFLFLDWINKFFSNEGVMAPTELADAIWQQHILDTYLYERFSLKLTGSYIHRYCPFEKDEFEKDGSVLMICARDTKEVQGRHGADGGFSEFYFGVRGGRSF